MRRIFSVHARLPLLLLASASACATAPANSASRRTAAPEAQLPVPLVTALFDNRFTQLRASPEYAVATLPPGFPPSLVPAGPVRVVGGLVTGDEVVAIFADSTRRLAAVFEELFEREGYRRPAAARGQGFSQASGTSSTFCKDSATLSAEPLVRTNRDFTRVTYRRLRGGFSCSGRTDEPRPDSPALKLPELVPFPGTRVVGSRGGSGSDGVESEAQVTGTALVPSAVVAHYASQLVSARWIAAAPAVGERVTAQFFEVTNEAGAKWDGVLMAVGSDRALTLTLKMRPWRGTR